MPAFLLLLFRGREAVELGSLTLPRGLLLPRCLLLPWCRQPALDAHSTDQMQQQMGKQLGAKLELLFK